MGVPLKIDIRHDFPCDCETYWRSFTDPAFIARMESLTNMERTVLSEETLDDGTVKRLQRFQTQVNLPAPAAMALGIKQLYYDQESLTDAARFHVGWKVIPPAIPEKIKAAGTLVVEATDTGCRRIVEGDVRVTIPMMGNRIETMVVEMLGKSYDASARLRLKWLEDNA